MKFIVFSLTALVFLTVQANDDISILKSRVYFEKELSEEDISGWEKDFFKDHNFRTFDQDPDMDEVPDDAENVVRKIKIKKFPLRKQLIRKKTIKKATEIKNIEPQPQPDPEQAETSFPKENPDKRNVNEKPIKIKDIETPLTEAEIKEAEEKPDESENEIDRSDRIRKMKELLKKRKGKKRLEDRRVY